MNARRRLLAASLAALSLPVFGARQEVRGSGRVTSERRSLAGFDRIAVAGTFELELRQGSVEGVELSGDDNLLSLVETRIGGASTLEISPRRDTNLKPSQPIRIRIDLVHLSAVDLAGAATLKASGLRTGRLVLSIGGAGEIAISGLAAERLAVNIGGSGKVVVDGRSGEASLSIAGSGEVAMPTLAVDDMSVSVAGSGSAEVRAERKLKISIAGSGRVRHSGAAVPTVSIVGSGDVRRV
jgi:Putative auto-transporter adhesin, head GIN domain